MIENATIFENTTVVTDGTLLDWLTIDRFGILFGIFLGGVALFFKWKGWRTAEAANDLSERANKTAEEANRIAKEANESSKDIERRQEEMEAIREIDNIFSSDEMRKRMMGLRDFVEDNKSNFEEVFRDLLDKKYPKGKEISLDSGNFFHPFEKKLFNDRGEPKEWLIKRTMNVGTIKFLIEIVDPLEKVKADKYEVKHADYIAKECRRIFKKELEK